VPAAAFDFSISKSGSLRDWLRQGGQIFSSGSYVTPRFGTSPPAERGGAAGKQQQQHALFDPELVAQFERAMEQLSEDEGRAACPPAMPRRPPSRAPVAAAAPTAAPAAPRARRSCLPRRCRTPCPIGRICPHRYLRARGREGHRRADAGLPERHDRRARSSRAAVAGLPERHGQRA